MCGGVFLWLISYQQLRMAIIVSDTVVHVGAAEATLQVPLKRLDARLGTSIPWPSYGTSASAGLDLRACLDQDTVLAPGEARLVPTGLALYLRQPGLAALILPRSGLGHRHGVVLGNGVGLIDADYQGPIQISCWNRSTTPYTLTVGERVAQLVIIPVMQAQFALVDAFEEHSQRGAGGFGHTGQQ